MPARNTKTYLATTGPGASQDAVVPNNIARIALKVQNTGSNPGRMRFAGQPQGGGSDILIAPGEWPPGFDQADTCPQEGVFLASDFKTTWLILETVDPRLIPK